MLNFGKSLFQKEIEEGSKILLELNDKVKFLLVSLFIPLEIFPFHALSFNPSLFLTILFHVMGG